MRDEAVRLSHPYTADCHRPQKRSTFLGCRGMVAPWRNTLAKSKQIAAFIRTYTTDGVSNLIYPNSKEYRPVSRLH